MRKAQLFCDKLLTLIIPLAIVIVFISFPFYWTIVTALKMDKDILKIPIQYLPNPISFKSFVTTWETVGFYQYFFNSLLVSISTVAIIIVLATLVGYALSRFRFRGKNSFLLLLLCTQFLPGAMLLIPLFQIYKHLGLINSLASLILTYVTFDLPLNSILMRGFLSSVPVELEEAAMIDGCSRVQAIFKVIFPVLRPAIVAVGSFAFIDAWKEYLFALMFINDPSKFTIPVGLSFMMGQYQVNYGSLAAGSIIAVIPAILIFSIVQRYLVHGLAGAVKG